MKSIGDRMKALLTEVIPARGRFKKLEELTTIKDQHWKNWWYGQQRPYELMIQAVARLWPEYALWMTTGVDDPELGQFSAAELKPSIEHRTDTGRYLRRKVELDEMFNMTLATAIIKEQEHAAEEVSDEQVKKLVDEFFAMLDEAAELDSPPDGKLDLPALYKQKIEKDRLLKKYGKDRHEELREMEKRRK